MDIIMILSCDLPSSGRLNLRNLHEGIIELANKHNWARPTRNQHLQSDHRIATGYWTLGLACRVVWIPTLCFPNPQTKNEIFM